MGSPKRRKRIFSGAGNGVCGTSKNSERAGFCLVGAVCIEETVADCVEGEEQVTNPQGWHAYSQDNQGGTEN
jgi:hypothetical protein